MTNELPYCSIKSDWSVVMAIMQGKVPQADDYPALPSSDELWQIFSLCWQKDPSKRPSLFEIHYRFLALVSSVDRALRNCLISPPGSFYPAAFGPGSVLLIGIQYSKDAKTFFRHCQMSPHLLPEQWCSSMKPFI